MLHHKYAERPAPVKKSPHTDAWALITELARGQETSPWLQPSPEVLEHFYILVARRPSPQERDALIVAGWTPFQYGIADALARVQHHRLQQMRRVLPAGGAA